MPLSFGDDPSASSQPSGKPLFIWLQKASAMDSAMICGHSRAMHHLLSALALIAVAAITAYVRSQVGKL